MFDQSKAQSRVQTLRRIVRLDVQVDLAGSRARLIDQLGKQRRADAVTAMCGAQRDIDNADLARHAVHVDAADRTLVAQDQEEIRILVSVVIKRVLCSELLLKECALCGGRPRHRREFGLARGGIQIAQKRKVRFGNRAKMESLRPAGVRAEKSAFHCLNADT